MEECRKSIEEAIGADKTDDRAKNVKERFDHDAALQVEEGDARGNIHGKKEDEPGGDSAPELAEEKQEATSTGAEKYDVGPPGKDERGRRRTGVG